MGSMAGKNFDIIIDYGKLSKKKICNFLLNPEYF